MIVPRSTYQEGQPDRGAHEFFAGERVVGRRLLVIAAKDADPAPAKGIDSALVARRLRR